jgi:hypothetical protein
VKITDEYAADAPWNVGFALGSTGEPYELELGADPVSVDQPIAEQLLENPMIEVAS